MDLTGQQFGKWKVLGYSGDKYWKCQCQCGVIQDVRGDRLRNGTSKSCRSCARRVDLTGQKFGEWTVLEYLGDRMYKCQCSCGAVKEVLNYSLTSGKSKSCGHDSGAFKDETGNVYGELTVIKYLGDKKWYCRCSCGKYISAEGKYLRSGKIVSCGHKRREDLTNKQFGYWTALKYAGDNRWLCRCTCGTEREVLTQALVSGRSSSCGCGGKDVKENFRQTMLSKYNEVSMHRVNNPRELWQIETIDDKDKLLELINKLTVNDDKPLLTDLSKTLNVSPMTMARAISSFRLEEFVNESSYYSSDKEIAIYNFIKSIYNGVVQLHNRSVISPYELDIYLPEKNTAIEFNGTYWHSEIYKDRYYHYNKTKKCAEAGIRLIHIFEYEWDSDNDCIKRYLADIIVDKNVIYARDTELQELDNDVCDKFLNKYHLQYSINSSIRLGLYHNNDLIGVMTLGTPRFNDETEYEILRIAWKYNFIVVGGAEKLFKYFVDKYKPKSIISYCNLAKFTGTVYNKLGFKLKNVSVPNYVWTNGPDVLSRYKTTKDKLVQKGLGEPNQSEKEIMQGLGYFRVYDCGNAVYIWESQEG